MKRLFLLSMLLASVAQATTFQVTRTSDSAGACLPSACSLREAVMAANLDTTATLSVPHIIQVPAGVYRLTLIGAEDQGAAGDLDIRNHIHIVGAGAGDTIIDGGSHADSEALTGIREQVFSASPQGSGGPISVKLQGLKIRGGERPTSGLVATNAHIQIDQTIFADHLPAEAFSDGGGNYSSRTQVLISSTQPVTATVVDSEIVGANFALSVNSSPALSLTVNVIRSTFSGARNAILANSARLNVVNSTFYNSGVGVESNAAGSITHSTFVGNGIANPALFKNGDVTGSQLVVKNSILGSIESCDRSAPFASQGNNVYNATTGCNVTWQGSDKGVDLDSLKLGPQTDQIPTYAGFTRIFTLEPGSSAIDAATCTDPQGGTVGVDQRTNARALDGDGNGSALCDAGAYEAPAISTLTVTPPTWDMLASEDLELTASSPNVTWTASWGTVTGTATALYTPPATTGAGPQVVWVTATDATNPSRKATAVVVVRPNIVVFVDPPSATLSDGQTQQFTARVTGTGDPAVFWTPEIRGSVLQDGTYTAAAGSDTVLVRATSRVDVTRSGTAEIVQSGAPAPPTNLTAVAGDTTVALAWNASGGATSYNVKRGTQSGGPYALIATVAGPAHFDTGLTNGVLYSYIVTAVNSSGESTQSNQKSAQPFAGGGTGAAPPPPTNLTAIAGDAQVSLAWTGSTGATSYRVKRGTQSGGPYTLIATVPGTTHVDTGLTNGVLYSYIVTAVNSAGESTQSNQKSAQPKAGTVATGPPAPTNLTAAAGDTQVTLAWTGSTGATSYRVKRGTQSGGPYTLIATVTGTTHVDTGLTNGVLYSYVVTAANSAGESLNSNQKSAQPRAGTTSAPPAPTLNFATAGNASVSLNWNASPGATSYRVKRGTQSGGPYTLIATVTGTMHVDTGLTNGVLYSYIVTAVNSVGESPQSNQKSAQPTGTALSAPILQAATAGVGQVTITWTAGTGATSYNVKRGTQSGGPYTTIANIPASTTFYVDSGLPAGVLYSYVLTAVNATTESATSNQKSALTR
jgi:fibronectin type 3 domain-containing protein